MDFLSQDQSLRTGWCHRSICDYSWQNHDSNKLLCNRHFAKYGQFHGVTCSRGHILEKNTWDMDNGIRRNPSSSSRRDRLTSVWKCLRRCTDVSYSSGIIDDTVCASLVHCVLDQSSLKTSYSSYPRLSVSSPEYSSANRTWTINYLPFFFND